MNRPRLLALLLPLLLSACGDIQPGARPADHPAVKDLVLATVAESPLGGGESFVGTVASQDRGNVAARTQGVVEKIAVHAGSVVKRGDHLLLIAGNEAGDRLREAEAAASEARRRLAAARARSDLAAKTFERYRRLFEREAVTPQEMDRASAEMAEARQGVAAAQAAVARAQAGRGAAGTAFSYGRVTAPYDARVVRVEVEEGSTVLPGTPLLVLDRLGGWEVKAHIPESLAGKIRTGDPVLVEIPSAGRTVSARISEVEPSADPVSRSFRATAEISPDVNLTAGLFARLILPGGDRPALIVPPSAVVERGQLTGVYVVRNGLVHYRLVKTGRVTDAGVEILSGVERGESVVAGGVDRVRSGMRVEN